MSLLKGLALGASVAAAGGAALLVMQSRRWIAPPRVHFDQPDPEHAEEVRFTSQDGTPLAGWLLHGRPSRPVLLLCHGYQRCMEETFSLGAELRARGFNVLLFDFRGCGRSGGRYTTIGAFEWQDVVGAAHWLRSRYGEAVRIGALGISMGGAAVISAAARTETIGAVVSDSAFAHLSGAVAHRFRHARFPMRELYRVSMIIAERLCGGRVAHVRPVDAIGRIAPRPLLLVHGKGDGTVPYDHCEQLVSAAGPEAEVWVLPDGLHANARFEAPREYVERIARFFEEALSHHQPAAPAEQLSAVS